MPLVSVQNLVVRFASPRKSVVAVDDCSLTLEPGEVAAVIGPSGCGKTTLLHAIAGIVPASSGTIERPMADAVHQVPVALIFQRSTLFPWLSVKANVAFGLHSLPLAPEEKVRRTRELIEAVGMVGFEALRPEELSGGMTQRVSLARALAVEPPLILMDEPLSQLDAFSREELHEELVVLQQKRRFAILLATHDLGEAVTLCDRVFIMSERPGRVLDTVAINLPRPRVANGVRCIGFQDVRNELALRVLNARRSA